MIASRTTKLNRLWLYFKSKYNNIATSPKTMWNDTHLQRFGWVTFWNNETRVCVPHNIQRCTNKCCDIYCMLNLWHDSRTPVVFISKTIKNILEDISEWITKNATMGSRRKAAIWSHRRFIYMVPIPRLIGGCPEKWRMSTDFQAIFAKSVPRYDKSRSPPIKNLFWIPGDPNPVISTMRRQKRFMRLLTRNVAICAKN